MILELKEKGKEANELIIAKDQVIGKLTTVNYGLQIILKSGELIYFENLDDESDRMLSEHINEMR